MKLGPLLKRAVIEPTLDHLAAASASQGYINSQAAINLILMIMAHESGQLTYTRQVRGPALGFIQMEPATYQWLVKWLGKHRPHFLAVSHSFVDEPSAEQMIINPQYAVCMARLNLLRFPEALPDAEDLPALAAYAKKYWNTSAGKATENDYLTAYQRIMEQKQ
ncbi:hypothetical protein BS333_14950 [Vibrio azureus]|uniref:Transglycosylase SLT domain-containing protein n=2 Tax=Vibrio azureus TaxID=512649 RepID=U3CIW0_9VIBR|nr:hypothetical protein [Vibrio azureus]AUI86589.1 hypothetical protein BS333_09455 [Vibrio azureus]AUI87702.1 hypothetical protein BS333_14950 [Vibrio azureus]GAD78162.1 hypothetical protein VAZ01S_136_00060 [Vibrio azureus NBRC 104587]GAD78178.1 hypothetical protein VAZ01S_139_00060 [Vibrio azureus NBRC 104587]